MNLKQNIYIVALFDIDEKAEKIVISNYNSTMGGKNKIKEFPNNDFLEEKDLHEIFDFLFANDRFLANVKSAVDTNISVQRHKTKEE